jgi:hypothetical protein
MRRKGTDEKNSRKKKEGKNGGNKKKTFLYMYRFP